MNRLDDIVVFQSLTEEDLGQIVELYIDRLGWRLADRRLQLAVTPEARRWLAERGLAIDVARWTGWSALPS